MTSIGKCRSSRQGCDLRRSILDQLCKVIYCLCILVHDGNCIAWAGLNRPATTVNFRKVSCRASLSRSRAARGIVEVEFALSLDELTLTAGHRSVSGSTTVMEKSGSRVLRCCNRHRHLTAVVVGHDFRTFSKAQGHKAVELSRN